MRQYIITHHPSFALFRDLYRKGEFLIDLERFTRLVRGEIPTFKFKVVTDPTPSHVRKLHRWALKTHSPIFPDIETTAESGDTEGHSGKNATRAMLKLVGIGNAEWAFSHSWGSNWEVEIAIKKLLADSRIPKVFLNGFYFDCRVLSRFGVPVNGTIHDARDARKALCNWSRVSLEYQSSLYTDAPPWKEWVDKKTKQASSARLDKEYNGVDCIQTAKVWSRIVNEKDWTSKNVQDIYDLQRKLAIIYAKMHTTGIYIDAERRQELSVQMAQLSSIREKDFLNLVGVPGVRCNDNDLRALLFKRHERIIPKGSGETFRPALARFGMKDPRGKEFWTNEEQNKISVDKGALLSLLVGGECPIEAEKIIEAYWRVKGIQKACSTFIDSELITRAIGKDGRIRADWNSCGGSKDSGSNDAGGTDTGRPSCSNPNLLNLSNKDKIDSIVGPIPNAREMYCAAPGNILIGADWSQQEPWIMWAISGDKELEKGLKAGDLYSAALRSIYKLPDSYNIKKEKPSLRRAQKVTHLSCQYGASLKTVHRKFLETDRTVTLAESSARYNSWHTLYSGIAAPLTGWWDREMERVMKCGYTESRICGRKHWYPAPPERSEAANRPVQSTAADWSNLAIIELDGRLPPKAHLIICQYDAMYVECPEDMVDSVSQIMKDVMLTPRTVEGITFSIPIELKIGKRWSDV